MPVLFSLLQIRAYGTSQQSFLMTLTPLICLKEIINLA